MEVRCLFVSVAIVVGGLFVAGCAQPGSPTSPGSTSLGSSLGPTAVVDHDLPPDEVEDPGINPCTGALTTLTLHFLKFVERIDTDASGTQHHHVSIVAEVTSSDGFSGKATANFTGLAKPGSGLEIDHEGFSFLLHNDAHQTIVAHLVAQDVLEDGNTHVEFEIELTECRGKPVA
jgi:hypothetical protein